MQRCATFLVGLCSLATLIGCSGGVKPEVVPSLEPVSGAVTLDGKPAAGVSVTFFPTEGTTGNPSSASTDADGKYTLTYRTGAPGVAEGHYVVLFSKLTLPDGSPIPEGKTAADAMAVDQIPERYRKTDNPRNTVTVPKGGKSFDFDLKSK